MTIAGLAQAQIDTTAVSFVQSQSGAPALTEGSAWWDSTNKYLKIHNVTSGNWHTIGALPIATLPASGEFDGEIYFDTTRKIGANWDNTNSKWVQAMIVSSAAPEAAFEANGNTWVDQTLNLKRVYKTFNGITGWHPEEEGYAIWNNGSANNLVAGDVVIINPSGSGSKPSFTDVTRVLDTRVAGVLMEDINTTADGVIALASSRNYVEMNVSGTGTAISAGDGLRITVALETIGRTCGTILDDTWDLSGLKFESGIPTGCFAVAVDTASTATKITVMLLGEVGKGMDVFVEPAVIGTGVNEFTDGNIAAATWREIDLESTPSSGDVITLKGNPDHRPIVGVWLGVHVTCKTSSLGDKFDYAFGPDASTIWSRVRVQPSNAIDISFNTAKFFIPTSDGAAGSYDAPGSLFQWLGANVTRTGAFTLTNGNGTDVIFLGYRT
jgi:hypothetical protein